MEVVLRRRADPVPASPLPVLVAAAEAVEVADFSKSQELTLSRQPWQQRAWNYYHEVGEIHFPARYMGNALAKIRLVGAEQPESDSDAPKETDNKAVKEAIRKLKSPMGGQGGLMRMMGLNIFVAAECFLVGKEDADGNQQWEALSINELEVRPGEPIPLRRRNPVEQPKPLWDRGEAEPLVVRVWQQDPQFSGLADGAIRTILDECEKLLLLTRADKAAARSRFAGAGLLFIPSELMPVVQQPAGVSGISAAENPIYKNLIDSMITPIKDESHPSGVVPITIFGPGEYGDKIRFITFDRPQAARAQQQREESITRIATALDLPAEILTGKADLNHWTAWQVREETFQQHFQPMVELICDALTVGYLHPALKKAGVENWDTYQVWYDDSALVVRPDKGQTAAQLHEALVISDAAWRRETGFAEEDAPPDDERAKRVGIVMLDEHLALTGEPGTAPPGSAAASGGGGGGGQGPGFGGDSPTVKDKMTPAPDTTPNKAQTQGVPTTEKPQDNKPRKPVTGSAGPRPKKKGRPLGQQLAQLDIDLMTQLRSAASEVMARELERAGARIRSKTQNNVETKELLKDVPNSLVASVLGPNMVASLGLTDHELMSGSFSKFSTKAAALLAAAQAQRNLLLSRSFAASTDTVEDTVGEESAAERRELDALYGPQDESNRQTALAILLAGLSTLAISKLYDPAPDAAIPSEGEFDGQLVPARLIREAVSAAGGSITSPPSFLFEPEDFGGIGTGGTTYGILADRGIAVLGREWVYGPSIRREFQHHNDLDGEPFANWDDEVLAIKPGDEWLGMDFYAPGDHDGCLCSVAPILSSDDVDPETIQALTRNSPDLYLHMQDEDNSIDPETSG